MHVPSVIMTGDASTTAEQLRLSENSFWAILSPPFVRKYSAQRNRIEYMTRMNLICGLLLLTFFWAPGLENSAQANGPNPPGPILQIASAQAKIDNGAEIEVESGSLLVPESRRTASERWVTIPFYRLKSTSPQPAAPIFLLAGGPGSSWLDQFKDDENFAEVMFYRSIADVVLFDQRGGGRSLPALNCSHGADLSPKDPLDFERLRPALRAALVSCRDSLVAQGVDLSAYNTIENAADVNALRAALDYERVTLIGGSYGSHLALQVMRLHPEIVERAVLYGVEGPGNTWDDPAAKLATLNRIAEAAEHSQELGAAIPKEGLVAVLERVLVDLEQSPRIIAVKVGEVSVETHINADLVRLLATRQAGRRSNLNAWPEMILAMGQGDFSGAASAKARMSRIPIQNPMHYSMDCASGISAARRERYERDPAARLLGNLNFEYSMLCDLWPTQEQDAMYRQTVISDAPTLIIHGTWDLSTPIENAQEVLSGLPNGRLVEVQGGGHGALYNLYEHWPTMHARMRKFLRGEAVYFPPSIDMPSPIFRSVSQR